MDSNVIKNETKCAPTETNKITTANLSRLFHEAILAGAIGDAFGVPMEFFSTQKIEQMGYHRKGADGRLRFLGVSSDDTQLTLFTAEGLLRFKASSLFGTADYETMNDAITVEVAKAYQRWLHTQGECSIFSEPIDVECGLVALPDLHHRVAPGDTCISALKDMRFPSELACNFSQGSGVVMKTLPLAMLYASVTPATNLLSSQQRALACFDLAFKVAQLTHGHPVAKLTAGAITTVLFFNLLQGPSANTLSSSMHMTKVFLITHQASILSKAFDMDSAHLSHIIGLLDVGNYTASKRTDEYGEGWLADEAMAISLHCALHATSFEELLVMSACHGGDSDTACSLAASLYVSAKGGEGMPDYLIENLALRNVIMDVSTTLAP